MTVKVILLTSYWRASRFLISETTSSGISVSPEIKCFIIILNFVSVGEPYDIANWRSAGLPRTL